MFHSWIVKSVTSPYLQFHYLVGRGKKLRKMPRMQGGKTQNFKSIIPLEKLRELTRLNFYIDLSPLQYIHIWSTRDQSWSVLIISSGWHNIWSARQLSGNHCWHPEHHCHMASLCMHGGGSIGKKNTVFPAFLLEDNKMKERFERSAFSYQFLSFNSSFSTVQSCFQGQLLWKNCPRLHLNPLKCRAG